MQSYNENCPTRYASKLGNIRVVLVCCGDNANCRIFPKFVRIALETWQNVKKNALGYFLRPVNMRDTWSTSNEIYMCTR